VDNAGVVDMLEEWRREDGYDPKKGGRPSEVTDRQALILLAILSIENQPLRIDLVRDLVEHRLSKKARAYLGVDLRDHRWKADSRSRYHRWWRGTRRVLAIIDPHPDEQRRRRYTKVEWAQVLENRDRDVEARNRDRLDRLTNAYIWQTVEATPREYLDGWDGTVVVDGTHVPMIKTGTTKRSKRVSSEPNAGWYVRNHAVVDDPAGHGKAKWAYDASVAMMANPGPGGDFPRLVLGISVDVPGVAPIRNANIALRNVLEHDMPRGYLVGDRAYYPAAVPEEWQIPRRLDGYRIVGDLRITDGGVKGWFGGADLVDGTWSCPGMPKGLREATSDYHAALKNVTHAKVDRRNALKELDALNRETHSASDQQEIEDLQARVADAEARRIAAEAALELPRARWRKAVQRRERYHLREREAPRSNGSQAFKCPALNPGATVRCPLRKDQSSWADQGLTAIKEQDLPAEPGPVCTNKASVTIPVEAGAKYAQAVPFQSARWQDVYHTPRNTIEGRNKWLKKSDAGAIAAPERRQMRGMAAQTLFIAMMVAADNLRVVERYRRKRDAGEPTEPAPPTPPLGPISDDCCDYCGADDCDCGYPNAPPLVA